ncbi:uncharacterized protein LOC126674403 [Mercurialis annua]|uniref:uncharacterized protein LOC126674403 n=1 Tax=Mercurialis annua TaxID=3986 RepID=UPI00215FB3CD|nr:uncharacterized protein LOC126674403 [Mercurialis annua]
MSNTTKFKNVKRQRIKFELRPVRLMSLARQKRRQMVEAKTLQVEIIIYPDSLWIFQLNFFSLLVEKFLIFFFFALVSIKNMSITQFAMVEELAYLVKDNLRCKHLVLSMEDAFINFLQPQNHTGTDYNLDDDVDGVMELEPMDPYSRLLIHRLADIFGFAHGSVGEGDDRHLILQRCPETSVPSILVSDILYQYDESEPSTVSHQSLRRIETSPVLKPKSLSFLTLEEREAAYSAARERIFSEEVGEKKEPRDQKPRDVPVVARRMIAHALGQKLRCNKEYEVQSTHMNVQDKEKINSNTSVDDYEDSSFHLQKTVHSPSNSRSNHNQYITPSHGKSNTFHEPGKISTDISTSQNGSSRIRSDKEYSKAEHVGAAKRMFAHALGLQTARGGLAKCSATKSVDTD